MVIPKKHYENIFDAAEIDLLNVMKTIKKIVNMYNEKLGIKNIQIVNSSGAEAQQDVFHLHFHIVPRSIGDNQNINWSTHKEWREKFNDLINKLTSLNP